MLKGAWAAKKRKEARRNDSYLELDVPHGVRAARRCQHPLTATPQLQKYRHLS